MFKSGTVTAPEVPTKDSKKETESKKDAASGKTFYRYGGAFGEDVVDGTPDMYYDVMLPSAGYLKVWGLEAYNGGMLLRVPDRHKPDSLAPFTNQPKTFEVMKETVHWNNIMGLRTVGDVNVACRDGHATDLIQVAEALQEKKIVQIAEEIEKRYRENGVRLVLITGPSSSGKTTVCKRLSIQLKACGLRPVSFSTDDYFVGDKTDCLLDHSVQYYHLDHNVNRP